MSLDNEGRKGRRKKREGTGREGGRMEGEIEEGEGGRERERKKRREEGGRKEFPFAGQCWEVKNTGNTVLLIQEGSQSLLQGRSRERAQTWSERSTW